MVINPGFLRKTVRYANAILCVQHFGFEYSISTSTGKITITVCHIHDMTL